MFEKFNQLAQVAATNVSRRQMFGRLGRAAAAAAAVLAGLLPSSAEARRGGQCVVCYYVCPDGSERHIQKRGQGCKRELDGCELYFVDGCGGP
jgi:hypothetical protein